MSGWLGRTAVAAAITTVVVTTSIAPATAQQPPQQPAQPGAQQQVQPQPPAPASPNTGRLSFGGGIDYTNKYYFRGIVQETEDLILQPYLNMTVKLYEADQGVL